MDGGCGVAHGIFWFVCLDCVVGRCYVVCHVTFVDTSGLTEGFRLRASADEVETWRAAAAEEGLSVAAWLRAQAAESPSAMDARRCHAAVQKALKDGVLVREPCEVCGAAASAHHDDYSEPLAVRWLCRKHHRQWHRDHPTLIDWGESAGGKARLTATVPLEIRDLVGELAAADGRSSPNMAGILIEAALGTEDGVRLAALAAISLKRNGEAGLGGEEPSGRVGADGASSLIVDSSASGSSSPPNSTSRAGRKSMCEHRVPADQFCKRCD